MEQRADEWKINLLPPFLSTIFCHPPLPFVLLPPFFISVKKQLYEINLKGLIKIHLQIRGLLIFFFFDHEVLIIFLFFHENMAQVLITFVRQFMWVMWVDAKMCLWAYADSLRIPLSCWIKMPRPYICQRCHAHISVSQSEYLIQMVDTNSHTEWQCRARSVGWRSQLIWIYIVCNKEDIQVQQDQG